MMTEFDTALSSFVSTMQSVTDEYFEVHYPNLDAPTIKFMKGRKYVRVYREDKPDHHGFSVKSVQCFIDMTNGDVLRPDGWKKPSMRSRGRKGNILRGTANAHINPYGIGYL